MLQQLLVDCSGCCCGCQVTNGAISEKLSGNIFGMILLYSTPPPPPHWHFVAVSILSPAPAPIPAPVLVPHKSAKSFNDAARLSAVLLLSASDRMTG